MIEREAATAVMPRVRVEHGEVLTNSRDVAEWFDKRHDHVVRDIRELEIPSNLGGSWYRERMQADGYGRMQPSFDMTRDGFTVLVMGWTGARAMEFKVRYIQAFNDQERTLRGIAGNLDSMQAATWACLNH